MKKLFVILLSILVLSVFVAPVMVKAATPQILTCNVVIPDIATYDCTIDQNVPYAIEIGKTIKFEGIKVQNPEGNWKNDMPVNPDWQILTYKNDNPITGLMRAGAFTSGSEPKNIPNASIIISQDYFKPGDRVMFKIYIGDAAGNFVLKSITGLSIKAAATGPTGGDCRTTAECKSGEICDFSTSKCMVVGASSPIENVSGVDTLIRSVARWIAIIISIIAVIFIILGGAGYITAGGNAEKAKEAQNKIIYGLIGLGVAALAWGAEALVRSVLKLGQ